VHERPYLLVSCAMSVDGYIDDASPSRLILSSDEDADRVDGVRAGCDAILVGAGTIRRDDPRLVIRSAERRARRVARGVPEDPVKVTITATGDLDPAARFFTTGSAARLVYCARPALETARARLSGVAEVIDAGDSPSPVLILCDLAERGVASVLLEGGGQLAAEFLAADLADELHLVVAPFFVGDPAAPRFAIPGGYPHGPANRMQLTEARQLGDVVLLRYRMGTRQDPRPPAEQPGHPAASEHPSHPASASEQVSHPAASEQAGHPSASEQSSHPAASEPGGPLVPLVPRPARSPEPGSPRAEDIFWLRRTIEALSVDDHEPPPPAGEHPPGDQPYSRSDQHPGQSYSPGEQSRGKHPDRNQSYSQSRSEQSPSGQPYDPSSSWGEQARSGESYSGGEQFERGHSHSRGEQPYGRQSRGEQSRGGQPSGGQPRGERPDSGQPPGGRPSGEHPYGGRPSGEQRFGGQRSGESARPGPTAVDLYWLRETIELSRRCPPSQTAFSVGAVIVGADGRALATGFSREVNPRDHAEEAALGKLRPGDPRLTGATLYSSLEPCGVRASRPHPCAELIIAAGLRRVVYAWREPPLLATGGGDRMLRAAGVSVTEVPELAAEARQVNAHLTSPTRPSSL
jgi:5-amino-6-(5-phosphoribosylamino)uracil reductase